MAREAIEQMQMMTPIFQQDFLKRVFINFPASLNVVYDQCLSLNYLYRHYYYDGQGCEVNLNPLKIDENRAAPAAGRDCGCCCRPPGCKLRPGGCLQDGVTGRVFLFLAWGRFIFGRCGYPCVLNMDRAVFGPA
jgi:hypothetical protein